jgi:hypothetical protein
MNDFTSIRRTVSLKGFIEAECPDCDLIPYGDGKYKGKCPLPNHREVEGESLLLDEVSGRCSCKGKCQFMGADICQFAAYLWNCSNTEAAKIVEANRAKYGPKQLTVRNKGKKKEPTAPTWPWRLCLQPFPKEEIANLARLRRIPELGVRRAMNLGLLWYLPERKWKSGGQIGNPKGLESRYQPKVHYHTVQASWVITDSKREQAIRRRLDGLPWDGGAKSKLLPGCSGKTQIGLAEALSCDGEIIVVEGGPDLLAALGYFPTSGVICMPSAYTEFCPFARRALRKRRVVIIPHADDAGMKALERWARPLAEVKWFELDRGAKDFNEWIVTLG